MYTTHILSLFPSKVFKKILQIIFQMRLIIDERDQLLKQKDNLCGNYKDTKKELLYKVSVTRDLLLNKGVFI